MENLDYLYSSEMIENPVDLQYINEYNEYIDKELSNYSNEELDEILF